MVGNKRPILVVESDPEGLGSLCRLLQREFTVHAAASAGVAMEVLREHEIHVVMAGQRLPEMTGTQLLRRVRQLRPATVRVALTAYCDLRAVIEASEEAGLYRYVTKPCDGEEVRGMLHQACGQYDQAATQEHLLESLQGYQRECLQFLEELRHGILGELNLSGHMRVVELTAVARELLGRLPGTPGPEADGAAAEAERLPRSRSRLRYAKEEGVPTVVDRWCCAR